MSEIQMDRYRARYAQRTRGMTASEIRALFAVASRPEVVFLAGGMPHTAGLDYDAFSEVTESVIRDVGATALQYGGGQGLPELREALVQVMGAESIPAHADDLVITSGGQQGLDLVGKLFCDPGDVVLAEGPSYVGALGAFSAYQAAVVHVPIDADGLIPEALEQTLQWLVDTGRTAKFLYTVPNHQNPAGVSLSTARRERILELAEQFDLLVVEDNPYGLLDFKGELRPALKSLDPERVVYVGTLSKVFAPGIRIGWVAAEGPIRDKLILLKEAADLCHSNFTQYVAHRWLTAHAWLDDVDRSREVYRERCEALLDALASEMPSDCRWSAPAGGFFVWVRLPDGLDARELLARAIRARVAYVPGQAFYADGGGGDHVRLSFGFSNPERIREGVRRLAEVIRAEVGLVRALHPEPPHREPPPGRGGRR
ncbi:MAG: PLP-dependent aminotransferase family protein [Egibacteraceae bacterium]